MSGKPLSNVSWAEQTSQIGTSLWSILRQQELRRFTKKQHNPALSKVKKEEEEDATLASKKQPNKKMDLSKIKCFQCGKMGPFSSHCP